MLFTDQWDRYTLRTRLAWLIVGAAAPLATNLSTHPALVTLIGMSVVVHFFSAAWYRDF
jgi:hypothetical protein